MPAPIQRYPQGMLELLGLKGVPTPNALSDVIQPVMWMDPLYCRGQIAIRTSTPTALGSSGSNNLIVPSGETWIVQGVQCIVTIDATVVAFRVSLRIGGAILMGSGEDVGPAGAAYTYTMGRLLPYPMTLVGGNAGSDFTTRMDFLNAGGAINVSTQMVGAVVTG